MAHAGNRSIVGLLLASSLKRSRKNHWGLITKMDYHPSSSRSRYLHSTETRYHHPSSPPSTDYPKSALRLDRHFFSWPPKKNHQDVKKSKDRLSEHESHSPRDLLIDKSSANNPVGLFGKLKQLTKLYGSAALVVYGLLGAVDFGLAFLTIYLVGEDHVRKAEDWLLEQLNWKRALSTSESSPSSSSLPTNPESDHNNMLWTTAVVAYTIHKTVLLPVRLGLTGSSLSPFRFKIYGIFWAYPAFFLFVSIPSSSGGSFSINCVYTQIVDQ